MITIGIDPHKQTNTAVAASELGRQLAEITVPANEAGQQELLAWAHGLGTEIRFALEDCRHVNGRLERFLVTSGEPVLRVGPRLMAGARKGARTRGKSDAIDALAIARAALREETELHLARDLEQDERVPHRRVATAVGSRRSLERLGLFTRIDERHQPRSSSRRRLVSLQARPYGEPRHARSRSRSSSPSRSAPTPTAAGCPFARSWRPESRSGSSSFGSTASSIGSSQP